MTPAKTPPSGIVLIVEGQEYPLTWSEFTPRESGMLKSIGHIGGIADIPQALKSGDLEAVVALAAIAMRRAGVYVDIEKLLDGKLGKIVMKISDENPTKAGQKKLGDAGVLP